ncbi:hypothetical protein L1887_41300 [Cichorium endivia]|nr:hypothetical protein L1887_41300 [Cichorium endivia]
MLTLEPFSEDQGRSAVHPARGIPPISFLAPCGFTHPLTRTHVRLLGPCFKTGRMGCPQAGAGSTQLGLWPPHQSAPVHAPSRSADRLSPFHIRPGRIAGPHSLPSRQFQALFDSLFKVLFIFPSRYLFAIGLTPVFSLGRNLPPYWGCIPKQPDSQTAPRGATGSGHDGALTLSGAPFQGTWARSAAEDASPDYNSDSEAIRFSSWADPGSLADLRESLRALGRMALGATCVQKLDGSRDSAIHTKYRILLRSSSMREPRYPLPRVVCDSKEATTNTHTANGTKLDASFSFVVFLGTYRAGVHVHGSFCFAGFDNDPSAGSPTETLLRLLLPLNDKVQWNSRDVAGGEPPTSPRS